MRNSSAVLERAHGHGHAPVQPVAIPTHSRKTKDEVLNIRINAEAKSYIEEQLRGLGIENARDRTDFCRGAIFAAITNAKRARQPAWQKFVEAIQGEALKHLGTGLELDGAREIVQAGWEA